MKNVFWLLATVFVLASWSIQAQESDAEIGSGQETEASEQQPAEVPEQEESEALDGEAAEPQRRGIRRLGDVVGEGGDEWSMDIPSMDLPPSPVQAQPDVSLPDSSQDARLQSILTRRAFAPEDTEIQAELSALMDDVEADAVAAMADGDLNLAQQLVSVIATFSPNRSVIQSVQAEVTRRTSVAQTLAQADEALAAGELVNPPGQSATDLYRQVLALDSDNEAAQLGLESTHQAMLERALELGQEFDFEAADSLLVRAEDIHEAPAAVEETRSAIARFRESHLQDLDRAVQAEIDAGRYDEADQGLTQLVALGHDRARVEALRGSLSDARVYGNFEPGQVFTEEIPRLNREGPSMVVIPAGSFMMGSSEGEDDRVSNEGPRHRVSFERGFALGLTEVTVGQFRVFIRDTGYRTDAERAGSSRIYDPRSGRMDRQNRITWENDYIGGTADEDLPVIHVSWNDAQAYARWLSEQTGRNYRLPSEAEFEYALRAGSQDRYWWGDGSPGSVVENLTGDGDTSPTNARWNVAFRRYSDGHWGPAPAGSFEANPFGLHDMGGNVMEWTEDCWHDSFVRAPGDGSAWVNPGCERRVIKGGAWSSTPAMARSAFRLSSVDDSTDMRVGFRVARDL